MQFPELCRSHSQIGWLGWTCLRSNNCSHRFLEELSTFGTLWKLYTYLFAVGVLLSKWKLQLLNTSWSRSLIFVVDRSCSFSQTQIRLLRRRRWLSFHFYNFKFAFCPCVNKYTVMEHLDLCWRWGGGVWQWNSHINTWQKMILQFALIC